MAQIRVKKAKTMKVGSFKKLTEVLYTHCLAGIFQGLKFLRISIFSLSKLKYFCDLIFEVMH